MRVRSIAATDLRRWLADVIDGVTAVDENDRRQSSGAADRKGGAGVAARTLRMLKAALAFAVRQGLIAENPARDVHPPENAERERERFLSPDELARLGKSIVAAEQASVAWQAIGCIKLLLATGLRKDEALSLRWTDIDFNGRRLVLPETKTGRSVRPLSRSAIAVLSGLRGRSSGPWIFPATTGEGHYVGLQKAWSKIRADAAWATYIYTT